MSRDRAGGDSVGPGRRLLPTRGPQSPGRGGPGSLQASGAPVQAPGAQPQCGQGRGGGRREPGASRGLALEMPDTALQTPRRGCPGTAQHDHPPARPPTPALPGAWVNDEGPAAITRRLRRHAGWKDRDGGKRSPWRPPRQLSKTATAKPSRAPQKAEKNSEAVSRGSGHHRGDKKELLGANAQEVKNSSRTRKTDRLVETAAHRRLRRTRVAGGPPVLTPLPLRVRMAGHTLSPPPEPRRAGGWGGRLP